MSINFIKSHGLIYVAAYNKILTRNVTASNTNVKTELDLPQNLKSWKEIPGPSSLPFIGMALNFLPGGSIGPMEDLYDLTEILHKRYGSIVRLTGGLGLPSSIFIFDIDSVELVLRSENTRMPERPGFPSLEYFRKSYRKEKNFSGLLTEHGETWKAFRSAVNPALLQPKTIKLYGQELDEVSLDMIKRIKSIRDENNTLTEDFEIELNKWALESIGVVALGGRIGCLTGDLPEDSLARQFIKCVRECFTVANKMDNSLGVWPYIQTPSFKKAMLVYEEQISLTTLFIKKAMEKYKNRGTDVEPHNKGVLEKLLDVNENVAVVMVSDMLLAGVDTTAHTILGILYLLGSNREKQANLRKEILSTSQNDRRPYMKACIKESLRLMSIASANLRRITKDYNIMGYHIPKGINVVLPHEYLSRMDDQYPKAKEFHPERWIVDKADPMHHGHAHPMTNSPFGFGVRSCIGRRIAELEIETFLGRFIENFEVEWFGPPPKRKTAPLSYVLPPYNFIIKDVKRV